MRRGILRRAVKCSVLLPSKCVVDRRWGQRSISHRSVLSDDHGGGVGRKRVVLKACHQGTPSLRSRVEPGHILLNHSCLLYTVCDHLPFSPGLVSADKESAAQATGRKGGGNLLSIVVGGIQEALAARPGAYKLVLQNRKGFKARPDTWVLGRGSEFSWILA